MADVHLFRSVGSGSWCQIGYAERSSTAIEEVTCLSCLRYALTDSLLKSRAGRDKPAVVPAGFRITVSPDVPPGEIHFVDYKTGRLKGRITGLGDG